MEEKIRRGAHKVSISDRSSGRISGVSDVLSFDEKEIVLETEQGTLTVKGKDLHIQRLTLEQGEADLEGKIDSLMYSDSEHREKAQSMFSRLFR